MFCYQCGAQNRDEAKFCRECGAPLAPQPPKKKGKKTWVLVACLCTILLIGIGFGLFLLLRQANGDRGNTNRGTILVFDKRDESLRNGADGQSLIESHAEDLGIPGIANMLGECEVDQFGGNTFYSYPLEYDGIPLFGRKVVLVADQDSKLSTISSGAIDVSGCTTSPTLTDTEVLEVLKRETGVSSAYALELVFYAPGGSKPELAYHISYIAEDACSIFVSATSGNVLGKTNEVQTLQGQGKDIHGDEKPLELASRLEVSNGGDNIPATRQASYVLADLQRNIYVYDAKDAKRPDVISPMELTSDRGTTCRFLPSGTAGYEWKNSNGDVYELMGRYGRAKSWKLVKESDGSKEKVAEARYDYADHLVTSSTTTVDAPSATTLMSRLTNVYDFYADKNLFDRRGFDGAGGRVNAVCNVDDNNAFAWAPAGSYAQVCCGKDSKYLDQMVIAHEYAHTVQASICELTYAGESGSIKEGTADILGVLACDYADNKRMDNSATWSFPPTRDPANPASLTDSNVANLPYPSVYRQDGSWADTDPQSSDKGGVHHNSTVLSHAAYLMCNSETEIGGSALTTTELGPLIMSSFHLVSNADCDYAEFAGYMSFFARENLDGDKYLRVEKALEAVGIEPWLVGLANKQPVNETHEDEQTTDDPTAAYAAKLKEYLASYGEPDVRAAKNGSGYLCSAQGVCVADVIDFDANGTDELLVVYYDKNSANESSESLNDGRAYYAEVWSYYDGEIRQVYRQQAQASNGGFAFLERLRIEDGSSWLVSEDYSDSHYYNLWAINDRDASIVHQLEIRGEYTTDISYWLDGDSMSSFDPDWTDNYASESTTYRLIDTFSPGDARSVMSEDGTIYSPDGCIDLTMDTMQRLGISTIETS